jgi:protein translocase SecG subunit
MAYTFSQMTKIFDYLQIAIAILLIISILLQHRGTSLGGAFGGEGNVYRSRRGAEKFLFYLSIVLGVIFVGLAIGNILIQAK